MSEGDSSTSDISARREAEAENDAQSDNSAREPLPVGFKCVWCSYDMSGSTSWKCPECGGELSEADFATVKRRRSAERSAILCAVAWGGFLGGLFVVTLVVLVFSRLKYMNVAPMWLLATLGLLLVFLAGVLACVLGRSGTRRHHLWAWTSVQMWLNAPWMIAIFGSLLLAPVAWIVRIVSIDKVTGGFRGLLYLCVLLGATGAIAAAWRWKSAFVENSHSLDLPAAAAKACVRIAGWMMFVVSLIVSVCVGLLGYGGLLWIADVQM